MLLAGFVAQLLLHGRHSALLTPRPWEFYVFVGLSTPAVLDWARGRIDPDAGTNRLRIATGVFLGLALARALYLNARAPLTPPGVWMLVYVALAALVGWAWSSAYRDPRPPAL